MAGISQAPGRLLIFVKYRPLLNDTFNATGSIDGKPLIVRKGYNSIVRSPQRFIGYWADATEHIKAGTKQTLKLTLPGSAHDGYLVQNGFINQGSDIGQSNMTIEEAEKQCSTQDACVGFTFEKVSDLPCNFRREGGQSLVIGESSLVILEGEACNPS